MNGKRECPHCGCDDHRVKVRTNQNKAWMICGACGARGPLVEHFDYFKLLELAINAWNARGSIMICLKVKP